MSLEFLGISPTMLTVTLFMIAFVLLILFIFIFLGINAFAVGTTFGAIINSLLPLAAGGTVSGTTKKKEDKASDEQIEDAIEKT